MKLIRWIVEWLCKKITGASFAGGAGIDPREEEEWKDQ